MSSIRVLALCGSTRRGSSNAAALNALAAHAPDDTTVIVYSHMTQLPHFSPDDDIDPLPVTVADLRSQVGLADAIVISTPEYAGSLPGAFKNLLDWLVGGAEISDKPVGWINVAPPLGRAAGTYATLAVVLGYLGVRLVDEACVSIPVTRDQSGNDADISDVGLIGELVGALTALTAPLRR
jgi:chromate reductase, NAD(P)H dehydrogenase (quinone)